MRALTKLTFAAAGLLAVVPTALGDGVRISKDMKDGIYHWDPQEKEFVRVTTFQRRDGKEEKEDVKEFDIVKAVQIADKADVEKKEKEKVEAYAQWVAERPTNPPPAVKPNRLRKDKETTPVPLKKMECPDRPFDINQEEYEAALKDFEHYCSFYRISADGRVAVIKGNTIVYACNHKLTDWQGCSLKEYLDVESTNRMNLNERCGKWAAGWGWSKDWKKSYGRDVLGAILCRELPSQRVGEWDSTMEWISPLAD